LYEREGKRGREERERVRRKGKGVRKVRWRLSGRRETPGVLCRRRRGTHASALSRSVRRRGGGREQGGRKGKEGKQRRKEGTGGSMQKKERKGRELGKGGSKQEREREGRKGTPGRSSGKGKVREECAVAALCW
jgi:hypothetical protein